MRAEERRREGCRKRIKTPQRSFFASLRRRGCRPLTPDSAAECEGPVTAAEAAPKRRTLVLSIGATILRSEESVAKATSLLGRTLRRASHAESERASERECVRACLPTCASVRQPADAVTAATQQQQQRRWRRQEQQRQHLLTRLPGDSAVHDETKLSRGLQRDFGGVGVRIKGDLLRIYRRRPRKNAQKIQKTTTKKTQVAATTGSTQVTLPGCQNHQDLADTSGVFGGR